MTSPLENLAGTAKPLLAEPADAAEVQGLLRSGSARLADWIMHTASAISLNTKATWTWTSGWCWTPSQHASAWLLP